RHTRSKRDWSSDVCSSDLRNDTELAGKTGTAELKSEQGTTGQEIGWFSVFTTDANAAKPVLLVSMVEHVEDKGGSTYVVEKDDRSEERRVGKEWKRRRETE